MEIIFVKKQFKNGETCKKCQNIEDRLIKSGHMKHISRTIIADESKPKSEGMQIIQKHNVKLAPFFVVHKDEKTTIYTTYFVFIKEVFGEDSPSLSEADKAKATLDSNPDLDFI